jgi:hypothetical protein
MSARGRRVRFWRLAQALELATNKDRLVDDMRSTSLRHVIWYVAAMSSRLFSSVSALEKLSVHVQCCRQHTSHTSIDVSFWSPDTSGHTKAYDDAHGHLFATTVTTAPIQAVWHNQRGEWASPRA